MNLPRSTRYALGKKLVSLLWITLAIAGAPALFAQDADVASRSSHPDPRAIPAALISALTHLGQVLTHKNGAPECTSSGQGTPEDPCLPAPEPDGRFGPLIDPYATTSKSVTDQGESAGKRPE